MAECLCEGNVEMTNRPHLAVIAFIVSMLVVSLFIGCAPQASPVPQDAPAPAETTTGSPEPDNASEGVTAEALVSPVRLGNLRTAYGTGF